MLLLGKHLLALEMCDADGATPTIKQHMTAETRSVFHLLDVQGLVESGVDGRYTLTSRGRKVVRLIAQGRELGLLPPRNEIARNWRFLGSEILAALSAAASAGGAVTPVTQDLLSGRGLAATSHDRGRAGATVRLTSWGVRWLALARGCMPHLRITPEIAATIRRLPPSYSPLHEYPVRAEHLWELEAMDLLVWSVPDAEVYALTALGEAALEAVEKGGYPHAGIVLDERIMRALTTIADHSAPHPTARQYERLQRIGYLDSTRAITAAGEAALRAARILEREPRARPASFAISRDETELLRELQSLEMSGEAPPTKTALHRVLLDRPESSYQDFVGAYGRSINDDKARKREARERQAHRREEERAFGRPGELDELLMRLEAWGMVSAAGSGAQTSYHTTPRGQRMLDELRESASMGQPLAISATAVKAITSATTASRFGAPATVWVRRAHEEGLIGAQGITRFGRYIADLALTYSPLPILTRAEARALAHPPEVDPGSAPDHAMSDLADIHQTLDRLEARGLIDCLVDGHIIRTEAGLTLTRAVQGALELAYPVTPDLLALLRAIHQVNLTLYAKDRSGFLASETWDEVERLSGLSAETFREVVHLARLGQYLGDANLTDAGEDLIAVMAPEDRRVPVA